MPDEWPLFARTDRPESTYCRRSILRLRTPRLGSEADLQRSSGEGAASAQKFLRLDLSFSAIEFQCDRRLRANINAGSQKADTTA
jgi:hypothetical protein